MNTPVQTSTRFLSSGHSFLWHICALVTCASLLIITSSCTPKPARAEDTAQDFLSSWAASDFEHAAEKADLPQATYDGLVASWDGMGAQGLEYEITGVNDNGSSATVEYDLTWNLSKDRKYSYPSSMALSKTDSGWNVRWKESLIHPKLGAQQHLEMFGITAPEAAVVGSDGAALLEPGTIYRVTVQPKEARNLQGVMNRIASELDQLKETDSAVPTIDPRAKAEEAQNSNNFSVVTLNEQAGKALESRLFSLAGVKVSAESALVRPDPGFAPDILSRVATIVESDLKGENGWKIISATPEGREVAVLYESEPVVADAVHISLDKGVQEAAQNAVNTRAGMKAMMVVMRISTGEILAVAQTPEADKDGDVALSGQYPPGSVFKIISASAGIDDRGLTPGSTVGCPGTQEIGHRIVTNYNGFSMGNVSLDTAFARSCNTTFADISAGLQPGQLKEEGRKYGLGQDFDIPGLTTITGSIPEGEELVDRVEAGFGQGKDLASPFGMTVVSASVAAGQLVVPQLITTNNHGTVVKGDKAEPIDSATAEQVRSMMRSVVTQGTATAIAGMGPVFGKTGEAEIAGGSHAWFTGFRDDLAFTTLIVLGGGSEASVDMAKVFFQNLDG